MIKTKFKTFLLGLVTAAALSATQPLIEFKTGYFFFSDSTMRKIYDRNGIDFQLCASYPLCELTNKWTLNAYGAVEYFRHTGKSIGDHQNTSLWSIPINLGLKPVYAINDCTQLYFAMGPRYFYLQQHNNSSFVSRNRSRNGLGLFVNTGINYFLSDCWAINLFGEYSYAKTHFHGGNRRVYTRRTQVGGYTFGVGLGYSL